MPGGQCSSAHIHELEHSLSCFLDNSTSALKRVVLLLCSSRCYDPAAGEELEKYVLCLYCGKSLIQVTQTHSPCSPSFCRTGRAQRMMRGEKTTQKGETKEQKQRLALFEIILSCTSHFFLLLRETQTDTFIQALCCGDSGFKAE